MVDPAPDHLGDRAAVLPEAIIFLGIRALRQVAEAGAGRVDEDEVGDIEQAVGIVEQRIGRRAIIARVRGDRHPLRPEGPHLEPHGTRARPAVVDEEHRTRRVSGGLHIGGGDDHSFGLAVVAAEDRVGNRRAVGDTLPPEGAGEIAGLDLRGQCRSRLGGGLSLGRFLRGRGQGNGGDAESGQRGEESCVHATIEWQACARGSSARHGFPPIFL
jgi:hypothetical protein